MAFRAAGPRRLPRGAHRGLHVLQPGARCRAGAGLRPHHRDAGRAFRRARGRAAGEGAMKVSVALALAARQEVVEVDLPEGATVREAVEAARLERRFPGVDIARLEVGIWSRTVAMDARLREGDRVELYRPLAMDAKARRR